MDAIHVLEWSLVINMKNYIFSKYYALVNAWPTRGGGGHVGKSESDVKCWPHPH